MDSGNQKVVVTELLPLLRVYEDGHVERLIGSEFVPPSLLDDLTTTTTTTTTATTTTDGGVSSKDVTISPISGVSARIYLPKLLHNNQQKFPVLVYFHGGGFCLESAFSFLDHQYLNILVSHAKVIAVSVEYRRAPEHFLPTAYDDCWEALQWVSSHSQGEIITTGSKSEPWLTNHADFERVFMGGDSAGANIVHNMAMRAATHSLHNNLRLTGAFLAHPYFWGSVPIGAEARSLSQPDQKSLFLTDRSDQKSLLERIWLFVYPSSAAGIDDPMINPVAPGAPSLAGLGCSRVLVCVAGKDILRDRGILYSEALKKSGWKGEVELFEVEGEDHSFHIFNPATENAGLMIQRLASFLNHH